MGRSPDSDGIIVPKSFADTTNSALALTNTWINNQIAAAAANLTTQSYVDSQVALRAQQADVTTADNAFVAATQLNIASGVAGLDTSGDLISTQIPSGVLTDFIAACYSLSISSLPVFDSVGTGAAGGSGTTRLTWTQNATGGSTCHAVAIVFGDTSTPPTVTYGGVSMSYVGLSAVGGGGLHFFDLENPPSGPQTVVANMVATFWVANSISFLNVASVGTLQSVSATATTLSQTVTLGAANQLILQAFGSSSGTNTPLSPSGGTNEWVGTQTFVKETISWATANTTFSVTSSASGAVGGGALLLTGPPLPGTNAVGTLSITGPTTVAPGTTSSTPSTVAFDALGTGLALFSGTGLSSGVYNVNNSFTHIATEGATVLLGVVIGCDNNFAEDTGIFRNASYGGVAMTSLGFVDHGGHSGVGTGWTEVYEATNVPGGPQTVNVQVRNVQLVKVCCANTVSFTGVGSIGALIENYGNTATTNPISSGTITPTAGQVMVNLFGTFCPTTGATFVSSGLGYNQTQRDEIDVAQGHMDIGEAAGAGSPVTFRETLGWSRSSQGQGSWSSILIPLLPGTDSLVGITQLATIPVPDPGYTWRAFPFAKVKGDSSAASQPAQRMLGTGNYGLLTVAAAATGAPVYGAGVCTGSFYTDTYPLTPYAAPGQTPTSVPPLNGAQTLNLYGSVWSGATYTFYPDDLEYYVLVLPAL